MDRTITSKTANMRMVHDKIVLLYWHFSHTFQSVQNECSCNQTTISVRCNFTAIEDAIKEYSSADLLNILLDCFDT